MKQPVRHLLKYCASSFLSSVAEEGIFVLLSWLLGGILSGFALAVIPTGVARFSSCLINYELNRRFVFRYPASRRALGKYFIVAAPTALLQIAITYLLYELLCIGGDQTLLRGVIYAGVMLLLFFVSYFAQQFWVFSNKRKEAV